MKGYYNPMPILIPIIMRNSMKNSTPITDAPMFVQIILFVMFGIIILMIIGLLIEVIKDWFS